jgi:hypothetical protein
MKTKMRIGGALLATITLLGCKETTSSEFIRTGGIAALMSVTADSGDSAEVHVELRVGGAQSNTYVILDGGDKLTARAGTETQDLYSVAEGVYEGQFANGGQVEFTVSLDRAEDADAPNSKATLPASFLITQPEPTDELSREMDSLFIVWTVVANTEGSINLSGSCISSQSFTVSGSAGMYSVPAGTLKSTNETMPEPCTVTVDMTFQREGAADSAFDDESSFVATQRRTTTFLSNP